MANPSGPEPSCLRNRKTCMDFGHLVQDYKRKRLASLMDVRKRHVRCISVAHPKDNTEPSHALGLMQVFEVRWLSLLSPLLLGIQLTACGRETSMGPEAPRPPAVDATRLVNFLKDPLVRSLPSLLKDQPAADPLEASLATLTRTAVEGYVPAVRESLRSHRDLVERYRNHQGVAEADAPVLAAIELVIFEAETLLESIVGSSGAPRIDLL